MQSNGPGGVIEKVKYGFEGFEVPEQAGSLLFFAQTAIDKT